jgi:hypothetical protein
VGILGYEALELLGSLLGLLRTDFTVPNCFENHAKSGVEKEQAEVMNDRPGFFQVLRLVICPWVAVPTW